MLWLTGRMSPFSSLTCNKETRSHYCQKCSSIYELIPWSRVLLEKLTVHSASWENLPFVELKGPLLCSQEPATDPCSEPLESNPHLKPYFPKIHSSNVLSSTPRSSKWSLNFSFPNQSFVHISHLPMHATCPTHLIPILAWHSSYSAYKINHKCPSQLY
jgi:hypothetical protein